MKRLIVYLLLLAIVLTLIITGGCTIRNRNYVRELIAAMERDDETEFDKLLKKASHYDIDAYDSGWLTRLVQSGNYTALQYACQFGYIKYAEKLLIAGANPNIYKASTYSQPALLSAIEGSYTDKKYELVKLLLDYGADVNYVVKKESSFALKSVIYNSGIECPYDRIKIAKLLIEYGARKDMTFLDNGKYITVYEYAIKEETMAYYGWTLEELEFLKSET